MIYPNGVKPVTQAVFVVGEMQNRMTDMVEPDVADFDDTLEAVLAEWSKKEGWNNDYCAAVRTESNLRIFRSAGAI